MTGFEVQKLALSPETIGQWGEVDSRHQNWPVVYVLSDESRVYVGETLNAQSRLSQHATSPAKHDLKCVRVVLDDTFNKSACLDLESFLISVFSGDGKLKVINLNAGITNADYYNRSFYRSKFNEIFEILRTREDLFERTLPEIINSDLFKLSPFKALNHDQAIAIEDILDGLFEDIEQDRSSLVVVKGGPGTGKTVLAIYLFKLLEDIRRHDPEEPLESDSIFSDFFTPGHAELVQNLRIGLVVPQQSLRESVAKVFKRTPGLGERLVLTPFEVGESDEMFDLLIVDEAHRLNRRANQSAAPQNSRFKKINESLFGADDNKYTQLDWIIKKSKHVICLLDTGQSVRPADLPEEVTKDLLARAEKQKRVYPLQSQMRVKAGDDYINYVRAVLSKDPPSERINFEGYDLRFFTDLSAMKFEIHEREKEHGLARLVAGYAWKWASKNEKDAFDIELDGERLRWNSTQKDWINSPKSVDEVGSIHTVQGYDLNYAGVIIGNDLRYSRDSQKIFFDRKNYHDKKGRENNKQLGITFSDEDILEYVRNIYAVLMTRGIMGTYIYAVDEPLREYLRKFF